MVQRRTEIAATLRQRLLSGLHLGMLRPGGKLPTVRELARELGTDPRVVLAAISSSRRRGSSSCASAPGSSSLRSGA
jgi:DNA-binding transcriptional regulator YhcF (GntR family)